MSDYLVFGKKGNGKSLVCVGRIFDALMARQPVATNLDLYVEHLLPPTMRDMRVFRVPDRPSVEDMHLVGRGSDQVDESTYGSIVLDECATMLNARTFNDKGRAPFLDFFVHSRKLGWHSYFICQNPVQVDKQVRESLVEFLVSCKRLDRVRIPVLGGLSKALLGFEIRPPKVHMAMVKYGVGNEAMLSDRWVYRGTHLYKAYNTRQVFREDYEHGTYMLLSPWHLSAVVSPPPADFVGPIRPGKIDWILTKERVKERKKGKYLMQYIGVVFLLGALLGWVGNSYLGQKKSPQVPAVVAEKAFAPGQVQEKKYSETVTASGVYKNGLDVSVVLSDGRVVVPSQFVSSSVGWEAEIQPGVWVKGAAQ